MGNMSSALDSRIDVSKALESLEKEKRKKEKSADRQAEGKYNEIVEYRKRLEEDYKRMSKELETANEAYAVSYTHLDVYKRQHVAAHTTSAVTYEEFKKAVEEKPGFIKAMWCGDRAVSYTHLAKRREYRRLLSS